MSQKLPSCDDAVKEEVVSSAMSESATFETFETFEASESATFETNATFETSKSATGDGMLLSDVERRRRLAMLSARRRRQKGSNINVYSYSNGLHQEKLLALGDETSPSTSGLTTVSASESGVNPTEPDGGAAKQGQSASPEQLGGEKENTNPNVPFEASLSLLAGEKPPAADKPQDADVETALASNGSNREKLSALKRSESTISKATISEAKASDDTTNEAMSSEAEAKATTNEATASGEDIIVIDGDEDVIVIDDSDSDDDSTSRKSSIESATSETSASESENGTSESGANPTEAEAETAGDLSESGAAPDNEEEDAGNEEEDADEEEVRMTRKSSIESEFLYNAYDESARLWRAVEQAEAAVAEFKEEVRGLKGTEYSKPQSAKRVKVEKYRRKTLDEYRHRIVVSAKLHFANGGLGEVVGSGLEALDSIQVNRAHKFTNTREAYESNDAYQHKLSLIAAGKNGKRGHKDNHTACLRADLALQMSHAISALPSEAQARARKFIQDGFGLTLREVNGPAPHFGDPVQIAAKMDISAVLDECIDSLSTVTQAETAIAAHREELESKGPVGHGDSTFKTLLSDRQTAVDEYLRSQKAVAALLVTDPEERANLFSALEFMAALIKNDKLVLPKGREAFETDSVYKHKKSYHSCSSKSEKWKTKRRYIGALRTLIGMELTRHAMQTQPAEIKAKLSGGFADFYKLEKGIFGVLAVQSQKSQKGKRKHAHKKELKAAEADLTDSASDDAAPARKLKTPRLAPNKPSVVTNSKSTLKAAKEASNKTWIDNLTFEECLGEAEDWLGMMKIDEYTS